MAIKTTEGTAAAALGASGVKVWGPNDALTAADVNQVHKDLQGPVIQALLPGALGAITFPTSGLALTVPIGSKWFARQTCTVTDADAVINVSASSVLYLYGCSDGILRLDASASAPTGFSPATAARLVKITSGGSALTLDYAFQQQARSGDAAGRIVREGKAFACNPDTGAFAFNGLDPVATTPVADPAALTAPPTMSSTYTQTEVQQLRNDLAATRATLATLVDALQARGLA